MFKTFLQTLIIVFAFFGISYSQTITKDNFIMIELGGNITLEMVKIHAGTFNMGSPLNELERETGEDSLHAVTISKDFYLGKYEVTQGQWKAIMNNDNPSKLKSGDSYPVEMVSWNDCQKFITALNTKNNKYGIFRLPTEAEWEYACRANSTTRYFWGNEIIGNNYCWYDDHSTHPVGQKLPNAFGLYDMSGNVCEWCNDIYEDYGNSHCIDPVGPKSGFLRVMRGGGFENYASCLRSARRSCYDPARRDYYIGFRLALSPNNK